MLRLRGSPKRFAFFLPLLAGAGLVFLFLTGQSGPPGPIRAFGIDPVKLEEGFGILVYPPDGKPALTADEAMAAAEKHGRGRSIAGVQLVSVRMLDGSYDGQAWVVKWDVDRKEAIHPVGSDEAEQEPPWLYVFSITFIDAHTGAFLAGAELSSPASGFERARDNVVTE